MLLAGLGLLVVLGVVLSENSWSSLRAPGGWWTAVGRLTGAVSAYAMACLLVLIARIPAIERSAGQDRLVRWHRRLGPWVLWLVAIHVGTITWGYAASMGTGFFAQLWQFIQHYPDVLMAVVAFGLLVMVGVTSIRNVRRRLAYETWWITHLYAYLALVLAYAHQVANGSAFLTHPLNRLCWAVLWGAVAASVLVFRVGLPLWRNLRHRLEVAAVTEEAPGIYSLTLRGKHLERLAVSGGQFLRFRFLTRELWWHAHPYSLSALPKPPYLRLTVKGVGDQSSALAQLEVGTKVAIEGPYGVFTRHVRRRDQVVLIGAGVGVTPLRALLEDLPQGLGVAVVLKARRAEELPHRAEIRQLVEQRGGSYAEVLGDRHTAPLDRRALRRLVPQLPDADLYCCGPAGFTASVVETARALGCPEEQIHLEEFAF